MYSDRFLGVKEMQEFLGLSRNKVLQLCKERPFGFPVVKVSNKYRADKAKLQVWYDNWYAGKFEIT